MVRTIPIVIINPPFTTNEEWFIIEYSHCRDGASLKSNIISANGLY